MAQVSLRRSPHIVCYWQAGRLVLHQYAAAARVAASAATVDVLDFCSRWQSISTIEKRFRHYSRASLRTLLKDLIRHSFLQRSDRKPAPMDAALESWEAWNPAAGLFHLSTKDVAYPRDLAGAARSFAGVGLRGRMPPSVKRYRSIPRIAMPSETRHGEFRQVLLERRTWRRFSVTPIALSDLSTVLELTWGVQHRATVRGQGEVLLKTSPSGGARHPGEVYVLALRVKGLERGLYHYASDRHELEVLASGSTSRQVGEYLPGQSWYRGAAALLLMTAVFAREQWRYRFARAYRAVLIEAGHLCQTCCLVATWVGLAPFCSLAFADSRIERDLGIDGVSESLLYVAGIGARPVARSRPWLPRFDGRMPCP